MARACPFTATSRVDRLLYVEAGVTFGIFRRMIAITEQDIERLEHKEVAYDFDI